MKTAVFWVWCAALLLSLASTSRLWSWQRESSRLEGEHKAELAEFTRRLPLFLETWTLHEEIRP